MGTTDFTFDVGQRVSTPTGTAVVLWVTRTAVGTDRGSFARGLVSPYLDREALADQETLEAWIEGELDTPSLVPELRAESKACACACGKSGDCHRLYYVDEDDRTVQRFPHTSITGACRCVMRDCACTH